MSSIAERPSRRKSISLRTPNPHVEEVLNMIQKAIFDDPRRKSRTREERESRMGDLWMAKDALKKYLRYASPA